MGRPFEIYCREVDLPVKKLLPGDRKRWMEKGKTLLLIFLVICCLGLLYSVLDLYRGQVSIRTVFWGPENSPADSKSQTLTSQNVVSAFWKWSEPDIIMTNCAENRDLVLNDDGEYKKVVESINMIMREAYSQKESAFEKVSVAQWKNALKGNSVYVRYPSVRPVNFDLQFYETKETSFLKNVTAYSETVFVPNVSSDRGVSVIIRDEVSGEYVKITTDADATVLKNVLRNRLDGRMSSYSFAYENAGQNIGGASLGEMIVIPPSGQDVNTIVVKVPRVYQGGINFTRTTEFATGLINLFGYNPNTIRQYANSDGAIMFVGETGSLSVHPRGKIEYKALGENEGVSLNQSGQTGAGVYSVVSGLSALMERVSALCGVGDEKHDAELKITAFPDILQEQMVFKFDYFVDGHKVVIDEDSAVSAVVKNGVLTELKVWVKAIEKTEDINRCEEFFTAVGAFCEQNPKCRLITGGELVYKPIEDEKETFAVWEIRGE